MNKAIDLSPEDYREILEDNHRENLAGDALLVQQTTSCPCCLPTYEVTMSLENYFALLHHAGYPDDVANMDAHLYRQEMAQGPRRSYYYLSARDTRYGPNK